jgi:hypothetical protein
MKKLLFILFISSYAFSQTNCELCVEQNGFYCGDDESNWTQYSPNGCVPNGPDLYYLNDGWLDCVDGSDENEAIPTTLEDCGSYGPEPCDTIYVYENIYDTITVTEFIDVIITEYIDCDSGIPCDTALQEILLKSTTNNKIYNILGHEIKEPKGIYIVNGQIKYRLK